MKSALLVIDVQRGLFDDEPRPFEADAIVDRINLLTARARAAEAPVVFVQHEYKSGSLQFDTDSWQLERRLIIRDGDIKVRKTTPDSFLRTNLNAMLEEWGTKEVVICGYASEFCIDTTTRRAAALGYAVVLVSDAHTTHDKPHANALQIRTHHNATLADISSFGPEIISKPTAEVAFGT